MAWVNDQRHYLSPEAAAGLRAARFGLGLSFRETSARTGVSTGHLCALERSQRCPSVAVARCLIEGLNLGADVAGRLLDEARPDAGRSYERNVTDRQLV